MKTCICFWIVSIFIGFASAQSAHHSHLLMLTVHSGSLAFHPEIIVTDENGQRVIPVDNQKWLHKETATKYAGLKHKDVLPENEDSLYALLKPFIDQGWTLSSSQVLAGRGVGTDAGDDILTRYFFTRQD